MLTRLEKDMGTYMGEAMVELFNEVSLMKVATSAANGQQFPVANGPVRRDTEWKSLVQILQLRCELGTSGRLRCWQ